MFLGPMLLGGIAFAQSEPAPVSESEPELPETPASDPTPVTGDDPTPTAAPVGMPPDREESSFKIGVGAFFNAGGSFIAQPKDRTHPEFAGELPFSGMAGFSPGAGFRLDIRLFDIVGIEAQLIRAWDKVESKYTINNVDVGFTARQPAWHVPLHLQLGVPSKVVRPYMFGGVDIVVPSTTEFPSPAGIPWTMTGSANTWWMWSFGVGFEGRVPIDGIDLRVPIQFRGAATGTYSGVATDRADYAITPAGVLTSMHYDMRWQYYASINLGLTWFFPY